MDPLAITDGDGDQMRLEELNGTGVYATGMVYLDSGQATQVRDWLNEWLDEQQRAKPLEAGDKVVGSWGRGTILAINDDAAWVKWDSQGHHGIYLVSDLVRA